MSLAESILGKEEAGGISRFLIPKRSLRNQTLEECDIWNSRRLGRLQLARAARAPQPGIKPHTPHTPHPSLLMMTDCLINCRLEGRGVSQWI